MKSVMGSRFSQIPQATIQRSAFDRSHGLKTTFDAGYLIPCYWDEALPGDTFNCNLTAFARLATPIVPLMDNMFMNFFFFAVPYRLLWENWEKFNGEQTDPGDSTDYVTPLVDLADASSYAGSIYDYFGLPIATGTPSWKPVAFHFRAYNLIWNEWFRDQNLQNSIPVPIDDGPDNPADYSLRRRGKRHDYFTSALPWPQKGSAVSMPLTGNALVQIQDQAAAAAAGSTGYPKFVKTSDLTWAGVSYGVPFTVQSGGIEGFQIDQPEFQYPAIYPPAQTQTVEYGTLPGVWASYDPQGTLYADLSSATAATINALRQAFQLQAFFERDARGGTRYIEVIKAHFGVTSPDARLQRPEYLGGGQIPININPVAQTSSTDATTPQGNLSAYGTASGGGVGFTYSATEHCVLIGLVSVRADLTYQQGMERMWSRRTRYDYYWPAFAQLGEQTVLNKEIYVDTATPANDDLVFGYQERYAEYRYKNSMITGLFRSAAAGTLDVWHLSQNFGALPLLDDTFIEDTPPVDRVIAVPSEPHFLYDSYLKLRTVRPMPVYSVPSSIGSRF